MSLTSSDGARLELVSLSAKAVVEDPLTFTELHLTFRNPEPRVREGSSRSCCRRRGDPLCNASETTGKKASRRAASHPSENIHEDQFASSPRSCARPKSRGNSFPRPCLLLIAPSSTKELIVSYSAERQSAADPFRIYLRGLPKLQQLSIRAIVAKNQTVA